MRKVLFAFFLFTAGSIYAGGFQLNTQGIRQFGMGHTGTALATDASCLFFNPAMMHSLQHGLQFTGGVSFLMPRTMYSEPSPGVYREYMVAGTGTPIHAYAIFRSDSSSRFAFGLGIYNPYGSRAEWPAEWKGQFIIRSIDLKTFYVQPTVSARITEWLNIGVGFVYAFGNFGLEKGIPIQDTNTIYGNAKLEGAANGFGWNAGLYSKFDCGVSTGLSIRSSVNVSVENGAANFTVPGAVKDYFPDGAFTTKLKLPSTISVGFGYAKEKWQFALDINRTGWSSYDSLRIDFATNTEKLDDVQSARMYKDVFTYRIGANYKASEHWEFRAGFYYDNTPVQDGYLTPETPDTDRFGITAGTSFNLTRNIGINAFYLFSQGSKRTDTNLETGFSGTYKTIVNAFGAGISCSF
jgi:long-chain fatty acid transport protein